jgi:hypothetical protein
MTFQNNSTNSTSLERMSIEFKLYPLARRREAS